MTLLQGDDYLAAITAQRTRLAAMADVERARLLPAPRAKFSFGEQLAAGFRQENLFVTHAMPLFESGNPVWTEDPDFEPEQHLGEYEQFTPQFPELLRAGSLGEMASIKNRIDAELRDRRRLEGMGFGRALAVYLPAGLLSPENFIPIGTAARAAGLVGKTAAKSIAATATRVGLEGAVTQGVAELALLQKQGFRTNQEALLNVVGAGLFSSVLGGAAGTMGKGKRAAMKKVLGQETLTEVVEDTNQFIAGELSKRSSPLGLALDNVHDAHRGLVLEGGSDIMPSQVDQVVGSSLTLDKADPLRGALLKALESKNKNLARLVGADNVVGKLMTKMLFLNPAQRTMRSANESTRLISDSMTKTFLTQGGAKGPSLESRINLAEAVLIRKRALADEIWDGVKKTAKDADLSEEEFLDLAGKAARRGGVNDDPVFAKVRDNPQLVQAVEARMASYREMQEVIFRTADQVGALSRSSITPNRAESLFSLLDAEYVSRVVDVDVAFQRFPEFEQAIRRGLEARRSVLLPEFEQEIEALKGQIAATDNDAHKAVLKGELAELEKAVGMLTDDLESTASAVAHNYTRRARHTDSNPGTAKPFANQLEERVLHIDERFIEDFLVSDVRELEARTVRSVMPDLVIADFWERAAGNQPRMAAMREKLDQLTKTVNSITETGTVTPERARQVVENLQDLADDSQGALLGHSLRLLDDLEAAGVTKISETMDEIDAAIAVRKDARSSIQEIDRQISDVRAKLRLLADEEAALRRELGDLPSDRSPAGVAPSERAGLRAQRTKAQQLKEHTLGKIEALRTRLDALRGDRQFHRTLFDAATEPVNAIATKVGKRRGKAAESMALGPDELRFSDNMFKLPGATTNEEAAEQLLALARTVHGKVTGQRRYVYTLNVGQEHLQAQIRRTANEGLPNADKPGMRETLGRRTERDIKDIGIMHDRLRNRHGVGATDETFALATKRIRDFNFMTSMGSVVLSSFPDMALAVSTAGMGNYARSVARFVTKNLFSGEEGRRTYGQELQRAMERFAIFKRHHKLHGLDDDLRLGTTGRAGRAFDGMTDQFARMTLMDRWNSMHKQIASQAIESRVAKTILAEAPKDRDLQLLDWFGIDSTMIPTYRRMLQKHSIDEGGLRLSNIEEWSDRNAKMLWQSSIMKGVNDTIITPSAGSQPGFATVHPLGKMLLQFRTFSFAATNQFLLPGLQRTLSLGDPGPAAAFLMVTGIGTMVYSINEALKGRDPTEKSPTTLVLEGIDRGGGLGILTEATSSGLRLLNGLGVEGLGAGPSRFRSRSAVDAVLGPTLGKARDAADVIASPFRDDFTHGDASRVRRMIPYQNLWLTRILLDGGVNAASSGTSRYFDDFLKIEHRALGFDPEEVP